MEVNLIKGPIDNEVFKEFSIYKGYNLFYHFCQGVSVEDFLATANILCPDMIQVGEYVFLADLFRERGENAIKKVHRLEAQFQENKEEVEQWVNSWSVYEYFEDVDDGKYINRDSVLYDDEHMINNFCKIIKYFWEKRAKELFPDKNIVVEWGDEIMGELGLTLVMYQKRE